MKRVNARKCCFSKETVSLCLLVASTAFTCSLAPTSSASPEGSWLPQSAAACAVYASDSNALGYCLLQTVDYAVDIENMRRHCVAAGAWESACREHWVERQIGRENWEILAVACGRDLSCAFNVIDATPGLIRDRLDRCERYTGALSVDCHRHALSAWRQGCPDQHELRQLGYHLSDQREIVGEFLALSMVCDGVGDCEGDLFSRRECERDVEKYRSGSTKCPMDDRRCALGTSREESMHGAAWNSIPLPAPRESR